MLEAVCPGQVVAGKQINCRGTCKTFPGGGSDWVGGWEITGVLRGHFLTPDSDDAVLSEKGCEPHMANWGGTFLLTRRTDGWKQLWFKAGFITESCHKLTGADRRDLLVCELAYGGQGLILRNLQLIDLKNSQSEPPEPFFQAANTVGTCGLPSADDVPAHTVVNASIERIEFTAATIRVYARYGKLTLNRRQLNDCMRNHVPFVPTKLKLITEP